MRIAPPLSPRAYPSSLTAPTPAPRCWQWFQGCNPVCIALGDGHRLWSAPRERVRLMWPDLHPRVDHCAHGPMSWRCKSDQPVGNSRPLLPTNKSHVRFEPRSRFLYRVSGYPQWSVRPEIARDSRVVARLTWISDFTARLSIATSSHVSELSAQLVLLRKQFVDARSFLPPYDQRQYEMVYQSRSMPLKRSLMSYIFWCSKQIKLWEQALEKLQANQTSAGAKPKFAFKRKKSGKATPDAPEVKAPIPPEATSRSPSSYLSLNSESRCLLTSASFSDASSVPIDSELIIANLDSCIVDLMGSDSATMNPSAIHIRSVANCVLLLPGIKGSILLHDLQRCAVVISGCHQVPCGLLSTLCLLSKQQPPPRF